MKFNISYPETGQQKKLEIDDDKQLNVLMDRKMGTEIEGDFLGDEFKGYIFRISGGNDKQGFTMKQGVLVKGRVRLLLKKGMTNYRPRRTGERKRKSVRGSIVGPDIGVLALKVVKKGDNEVVGLTDAPRPNQLGPKRANKIRKFFGLEKKDDPRKYVIRREIVKEGKKTSYKAPKIQRLVTELRLRRKRIVKQAKKDRWENSKKAHADYDKVVAEYTKEQKAKREKARAEEKERRKSSA
mmetsp:Transcript_7655/g.8349  ORF Transcript_7655/g.8349 Transcript_7655/m.8349 type:complete len:240 (-) Transcript_7655:528-1247(-)